MFSAAWLAVATSTPAVSAARVPDTTPAMRSNAHGASHWAVPPDAPDWSATTLDGRRVRLRDHRGHVVVLDFWGTWCPPCVQWLPRLVELEKRFAPRGVDFITVNVEYAHPRERQLDIVRRFMTQHGYRFTVVVDSDSTVVHAHQIQIFPTVMVVDAGGRIRYANSGASRETEASLTAQLEDLLRD